MSESLKRKLGDFGPKMTKNDKNDKIRDRKNGQKWSKMVKNDQERARMIEKRRILAKNPENEINKSRHNFP